MAKTIMVQGTASNAGKSVLVAALCRIFRQDGHRVAPFKAQNMSLNSFVTKDGLEMGRAQVMQAEAAGILPDVRMNPILLKPTSEKGSQVIVNGVPTKTQLAAAYHAEKKQLLPYVEQAFHSLSESYDIIVIEGAGSPAEINLKQDDFVNMGMARLANAPVLLVGDIDRGGVFASLYGTVKLLDEEEQNRIAGLIINKFRGDLSILKPGITMLEALLCKPVLGVIPYAKLDLDEEDSLSDKLSSSRRAAPIQIAVIRLPRLSNFTDFDALSRMKEVDLYYADTPAKLEHADMIILPGSKNTISDLRWLYASGLASKILQKEEQGILIFGICGGLQMMGNHITDPDGVEDGGIIRGLSLLPLETVLGEEKVLQQVQGTILNTQGILQPLSMQSFSGYEIHMGHTTQTGNARAFTEAQGAVCGWQQKNCYATYVHGIFDESNISTGIINALLASKQMAGITVAHDAEAYKNMQYNKLANVVREVLDMKKIYDILEEP